MHLLRSPRRHAFLLPPAITNKNNNTNETTKGQKNTITKIFFQICFKSILNLGLLKKAKRADFIYNTFITGKIYGPWKKSRTILLSTKADLHVHMV